MPTAQAGNSKGKFEDVKCGWNRDCEGLKVYGVGILALYPTSYVTWTVLTSSRTRFSHPQMENDSVHLRFCWRNDMKWYMSAVFKLFGLGTPLYS